MAKTPKIKESVPARFAHAVKDARERRKWSQAELAEHVGVSVDHVSKIERHVYQPSLDMAARFIKVLELDANTLLDAKPLTRKLSHQRREAEASAYRLIESLDDRTLDIARDIIKVLVRR